MGLSVKHLDIVILTNCTKTKLSASAPAEILYQGQTFKMIRKLSQILNYELLILSAKFGLLDSKQIISPYDMTIQSKDHAFRLWQESGTRFMEYLDRCDYIICFLSQRYLLYLSSMLPNPKIIIISDPRGIMGYNALLYELKRLPKAKMLTYLLNYHGAKKEKKQISLLSYINKKNKNRSLFEYIKR